MQVAITCRHGSVQDAVRANSSANAEKLLTYFERVTAIGVTVTSRTSGPRDGSGWISWSTRSISTILSPSTTARMCFRRSTAPRQMEQQIKKYKAKIQDHRRDVRSERAGQRGESISGIRVISLACGSVHIGPDAHSWASRFSRPVGPLSRHRNRWIGSRGGLAASGSQIRPRFLPRSFRHAMIEHTTRSN